MKLYQYDTNEISKKYLLTVGYYLLYVNENYEVDDGIIALFDISTFDLPYGNTLILHAKYGVFIDTRTTKQLINEFYKLNAVGFAMSKILFGALKMHHYLPFVHFYVAYMPMNGGSRSNTDWIALHLIKEMRLINGVVYVTTIYGQSFSMDFPKGNLEKRVHDVALLSRASLVLMQAFLRVGLCDIKPPSERGLLSKFDNCNCKYHLEMILRMNNIQNMMVLIIRFIFLNAGIESIEKEAVIKYYLETLLRLKKIY